MIDIECVPTRLLVVRPPPQLLLSSDIFGPSGDRAISEWAPAIVFRLRASGGRSHVCTTANDGGSTRAFDDGTVRTRGPRLGRSSARDVTCSPFGVRDETTTARNEVSHNNGSAVPTGPTAVDRKRGRHTDRWALSVGGGAAGKTGTPPGATPSAGRNRNRRSTNYCCAIARNDNPIRSFLRRELLLLLLLLRLIYFFFKILPSFVIFTSATTIKHKYRCLTLR